MQDIPIIQCSRCLQLYSAQIDKECPKCESPDYYSGEDVGFRGFDVDREALRDPRETP